MPVRALLPRAATQQRGGFLVLPIPLLALNPHVSSAVKLDVVVSEQSDSCRVSRKMCCRGYRLPPGSAQPLERFAVEQK